ncbi:MAG: malto-oligosyltrehalose trehalohydrolase [Deltaproteobacteria bacterium]|nr:malto-oligosyltrehalose trehalohydrolase [Deltaproteobacteria bacterium]
MKIGAIYSGKNTCEFTVWAPFLEKLSLKLLTDRAAIYIPMKQDNCGYWKATGEDIKPGSRYLFMLNDRIERFDPASFCQPLGIDGPSEIVDHTAFEWEDNIWAGIPLSQMVIYEIHAGTFTPEGTFDAIIKRLDELCDLGINAIELMPVSQFPGKRNWGYDGVFPFAVQNSYGGPLGFKRLVNECHKKGIAVILDVVYNHLGPEGNYLSDFGPYFTERYKTPWGAAVNFDGEYSDEVRNFFIQNAFNWFENYHVDALRLDAIHAIYDFSATPFLKLLKEKTMELGHELGRSCCLIAESDLNDPRIIRGTELYGYGIDAAWCDDFHHSVVAALAGDRVGYYADFGDIALIIKSLREGYVYSGQYSNYRKRSFGASSKHIPKDRFIVFIQNHDQVGNRMLGERLAVRLTFEALKLAAGLTILSPYIPMIFMGEEYGEDSPFLYFVDHSDMGLIEATKAGRMEEFKDFKWAGQPPDPQSISTFMQSKLKWEKREQGQHNILLGFYKVLIKMRRSIPALLDYKNDDFEVSGFEQEKIILMSRRSGTNSHAIAIYNLNASEKTLNITLSEGKWVKSIDSADSAWMGAGSKLPDRITQNTEIKINGLSMAVYIKEGD